MTSAEESWIRGMDGAAQGHLGLHGLRPKRVRDQSRRPISGRRSSTAARDGLPREPESLRTGDGGAARRGRGIRERASRSASAALTSTETSAAEGVEMGRWAWLKVAAQNRRVIIKLVVAAIKLWLKPWRERASVPASVVEDR